MKRIIAVSLVALLATLSIAGAIAPVRHDAAEQVLVVDVLIDSMKVIAVLDSNGVSHLPDSTLVPPRLVSGTTQMRVPALRAGRAAPDEAPITGAASNR